MSLQITLVVIAFFATVLGVIGKTTNSEKRGLSHISLLGYTTLFFAITSCVISICQISSQENDNKDKQRLAEAKTTEIMQYIMQVIDHVSIIQSKENFQEIRNELPRVLDKAAGELELVTTLYKDVIPFSTLTDINDLRKVLKFSDEVARPGASLSYLYNLNSAMLKVSKAFNDKNMAGLCEHRPYAFFELEFPDSLKYKDRLYLY